MADTKTSPEQERELRGHSTADLVREAVDDGSRLVAAEVRLAKQEIGETVRAGVTTVIAALGGLVAGLAFVVMAVVTIVVAVEPHWLAALVITVLFGLTAVAAAVLAVRRVRRMTPLRRTAETVKEDVRWAKEQLTRSTR